MKLFKISFQRFSMASAIVVIVLGLVGNCFAAKVDISRGYLLVNGEPFIIKGVNYSPVPIGVDPETTPPIW